MAELLTLDDVMVAPKGLDKSAAYPAEGYLTYEDVMGTKAAPTSLKQTVGASPAEYLRKDNPQPGKPTAGEKNFLQAADLALGAPAFFAQLGATGIADIVYAASGDATPMASANKKMAEVMATPHMQLLLKPLQTLRGIKEEDVQETSVGKALNSVSELIQNASKYWSEKLGTKEAGAALEQGSNIAMAKGVEVLGKVGAEGYRKLKGAAVKPEVTPPAERTAPDLEPATEIEMPYRQPGAAEVLAPEDAVAASKKRIADMKAALKSETPADRAARESTRILPTGAATWKSGGEALPVQVMGEPLKGPDGRMYTPAVVDGTQMQIPTGELRPGAVKAQVGLPEPKVTVEGAQEVTPLDKGLINLREGKPLDTTESTAVAATTIAGSRILGPDGKPIGAGFTQSGQIDPRLLTALGITSAAVWAAMEPEDQSKLAMVGLIGTTAAVGKVGRLESLGKFRDQMTYRSKVLEALPEGTNTFSKQQVLDLTNRPEFAAEAGTIRRVVNGVQGNSITAADLAMGVTEEFAGWKLTPAKVDNYTTRDLGYGAEIRAGYERIGVLDPQDYTVVRRLPDHLQITDMKHFPEDRIYGHDRGFRTEDGIRNVVEVQAGAAQEMRPLSNTKVEALYDEAAKLGTEKSELWQAVKSGTDKSETSVDRLHEIRARETEMNNLIGKALEAEPISPMLKYPDRRLIREILKEEYDGGHEIARFAAADVMAKVEGWPRLEDGSFENLKHKRVYDRYAGEVTRYYEGLGGVEIQDALGNKWWEVPVDSVVKETAAGPAIHMLGKADPKLLAAIAGGVAMGAYLMNNPESIKDAALIGIGGTMALKGKGKFKAMAESDLIKAAREGQQGAFTELYVRNAPQIRRSLNSFERTGVDVDYAVQRAFESTFKTLARPEGDPLAFRGEAKLSTYLQTAAQNKARNMLAMQKRRPMMEELTPEVEETVGHFDTPEKSAQTDLLGTRLQEALNKTDPLFREPFLMRETEGLSYEAIADKLGVPIGTVRSRISRAKEQLQNNLRDYKGSQRGEVDPKVLAGIAGTAAGAALGALTDPEHSLRNGIYGALAGGLLSTGAGRSALKAAVQSPDVALGLISTRLGNIAPELKFALRKHELRVFQQLDRVNDAVSPFLTAMKKLPKATYDKISTDLLNGRFETLKSIPELASSFPKVRGALENIKTQLQDLGRFGEGVSDYFPRLVKDFEGLKASLGQDAAKGLEKVLIDAEAKSIRKNGRSLTDVEQSLVANRYLFSPDQSSFQPGYARTRTMLGVPKHMAKYYEGPVESLLRYISGATNDIEVAKFFGRDLATKTKGRAEFSDIDGSVGNLTARLLNEGKITQPQAMELRDMLKARFEGGEKGMNTTLASIRNITNAALLGNIASAATQVGDSLTTIYHHGLVPTLQAIAEKVVGKSKITPKQLGLINRVAEELSELGPTGRVLHETMKYSGFHAIDMFAKGLGANAALIKIAGQLRSPKGEAAVRAKYAGAYEGAALERVIQDLKQRRVTPETEFVAFNELSDMQPVSRAELPELYLKHPNGRLLYQLKTYMLKQTDIIRRDAYQEMAKGTPAGILRGAKNLAALASIYAFANVPGDTIKDLIAGRPVNVLSTPKLVENIFQTFGVNRYAGQQLGQGKVVETAVGMATPPLRVMQDVAKLNKKSVSYVPFIGRPVYDRYLGGNEKREIYEYNMTPKRERQRLSPAAKLYKREQLIETKRKKREAAR